MLDELKEEEIVNKVGGRFKLSTLIQKRMIMLNNNARPLVDVRGGDKMSIVIQEILQDKIYLDASEQVQTRGSAGDVARRAMMGDISADLSTRRGHITGMDALPGNVQIIRAEVPLAEVLTYASQYSFRVVAILPAILLIVFGAIWLYDKARGGYKPVKIVSETPVQPQAGT